MFIVFFIILFSFAHCLSIELFCAPKKKLCHFEFLPSDILNEIFRRFFIQQRFEHLYTMDDLDLLMADIYHITLVNKDFNERLKILLNAPLNNSRSTLKSIFLSKKHDIIFNKIIRVNEIRNFTGSKDNLGNDLVQYIFEQKKISDIHFSYDLFLLVKYHLCDVNLIIKSAYINNYVERKNSSFLSLAIQTDNHNLIIQLLKNRANPDEQDAEGNTLLMQYLSRRNAHDKVIAQFAKYADLNIENANGKTVLSLAYDLHPWWLFYGKDNCVVTPIAQKSSYANRMTNFLTIKNIIITFGSFPALLGFVSLTSLIAPVFVPWRLYTGRWSGLEIWTSSQKLKGLYEPSSYKKMDGLEREPLKYYISDPDFIY